MRHKTPAEMARAINIKIQRNQIRLKYGIMADIEINDVIPASIAEFEAALGGGELKLLKSSVADVLDGINI